MADQRPPEINLPDINVGEAVRGLARQDLKRIALLAFVIGVLLHGCFIYAVLGSGGSSSGGIISTGATPNRPAAGPQVTPTPTRLTDRTTCDDIRGTDYRSETERQWFRFNCT